MVGLAFDVWGLSKFDFLGIPSDMFIDLIELFQRRYRFPNKITLSAASSVR